MSVAIADVRFAIQDKPQSVGIAPESPRVLGIGDGVTTVFFMPVDRFKEYYPGSPVALFSTIGAATTGIPTSAYTISTSGVVTFTTAPAANAVIAASFQAVVFGDEDLTNVLNRNVAQYGGSVNSDANVLRGCQIEILNILLTNPDKLASLKEAEWAKDPAAIVAAMQKQLAELRTQISSSPRPDMSIPVLTVFGPRVRNYQPRN